MTPSLINLKTYADDEILFVRKRSTPTAGDRKARILQLIEQIQRGDGFKSKDLKKALGTAEWQLFQQQTQLPRISKEAANLLRPYQKALQRADALHRRGIRPVLSPMQRFKQGPIRRPGADEAYLDALELLQQLLDEYPRLRTFLDRPVQFGGANEPGSDPEDVPRLRGSRSPYARTESTRTAVLDALAVALDNVEKELTASPLSWLLPSVEEFDKLGTDARELDAGDYFSAKDLGASLGL